MALAAFLAASPIEAGAQRPAAIRVTGATGSCPSPVDVAAALGELMRGTRVTADGHVPGALEVNVQDLGPRYVVAFARTTREIGDAQRECGERTKVVAVLVALALDPPSVPVQLRDRELPAGLRFGLAPPRQPRVRIELAAAARVEGTPEGGTVAGGGAVRAFIGGRRLGGTLGVSAGDTVKLTLSTGAARVSRTRVDLGAWGALQRGRVEGLAEIGVAIGALRVAGEDLPVTWSWRGAEFALRGALTLRAWVSRRFAVFAGFEVVEVPIPHELGIEGIGVVGRLPRTYLAGAAGLLVAIQ